MPNSLQQSIVQPLYTKGTIKLALRSKRGENTVWCIVEGSDDVKIYEKFFDSNTTKVLPSKDEVGRMGHKNVETIVTELVYEEPTIYIFGIRDSDYTEYDNTYVRPQNVFLTDNRDIEMMIFGADSVIKRLKNWDKLFPKSLCECSKVCRYLGYLRIYNEVYKVGCSFHNNIKISKVWDFNSKLIKKDWRVILLSVFIANCKGKVLEEQVTQFITDYNLENKSWLDICRGHDVINLLQYMMGKNEFSRKAISDQMIDAYSFNDFQPTSLCKSIEQWATINGVKIFRE